MAWNSYSLATELNKKSEKVQVATLLTVIGEEARDVYSTFTDWAEEGDQDKIAPVLQKFAEYCQPHKNVPFERYRFNRRTQEVGESYDQYKSALRKLAEGCDFDTITPNEILRDRLIFGIRDTKLARFLFLNLYFKFSSMDEETQAWCKANGFTGHTIKSLVKEEFITMQSIKAMTAEVISSLDLSMAKRCLLKKAVLTAQSAPSPRPQLALAVPQSLANWQMNLTH
ncbi:hypothetical protein ACROYT_G014681 [Oculina patagonica]